MKRVLISSFSIFLAITIIFSSAIVGLNEIDFSGISFENPFAVKSKAASDSDLTFKLSSDGTHYSVTDCNTSASGELLIPDTYNGLPVTRIDYNAFNNCTSLESVTIGNGVTSIGRYAFDSCTSLTSVTISDSVTSIGDYAFNSCARLTSITIPDSVTSIGDYAFRDCTSLTSITIPDSVTSIGDYAFYDTGYYKDETNWENKVLYIGKHLINAKTSLSGDYKIKNGTKTIADSAFYNCKSLTSITIPDSVTNIGETAFHNCKSLASVTISDSVTSIGSSAFGYCRSLTSITIPDSVTSIGDYAFNSCARLTSITIPDSVTSIGDCAFSSCARLTSITIPDSVTSIGYEAFSSCTSLTSVTIGDSVTSIGDRVFYKCTSLTSITIPDSVTTIGYEAFNSCARLTSITIPDSVISIGYHAFDDTGYYKDETNWENKVLYIGKHLINAKTSLSGDYKIKNGTKTIADSAFSCKSLTSITIPNSVTNIGETAFSSCTSLASITVDSANKKYSSADGVLFDKNKTGIIKYPQDKTNTDYTIPNSVTSIGYSAFCNCDSLESVTIGDSVTSIGDSAFCNCDSLKSITIGDSVTSIGWYAFEGCTGLTSVTIGNSVTTIGYEAFSSCTSLKSVIIGDSVTSIGERAFLDCISLKSIFIPDSVQHIGSESFGYYSKTDDIGKYNGFKVIGTKDSPAEKYAKINGFEFVGIKNPTKPTLNKVTNMKSGVKITWSKVEYADSYRVYRKVKGGSWKYLDNTKTTYFIDKTAKSGTKYYYSVRAKNDLGLSERSSTLSIKRLSSSKASKVSNTSSGVKVTWKKVTGASCYIVYRKVKGGKWDAIKKTSKLYYTDTKAKSGNTYLYTVRACNGSERSYYDTDGLSLRRLRTPKISSAISKSEGILLKWNKITGASGYYVYRKASSGEWKKIKTVKGNAKIKYLDETPRKGATYQYRVKACYGKTTSYNSNTYKIKCKY